MLRRTRSEQRRGVAAVEFCVVLPLLVFCIFGIWEVGRMIEAQQILSNAAREAGRQASTGMLNQDGVRDVFLTYLARNQLSSTGYTFALANVTAPARNQPDTCEQLDRWQLDVSIPASNIQWIPYGFFHNATTKLEVTVQWRSMKDVPLNLDPLLPSD